jgi:hypothetical protein
VLQLLVIKSGTNTVQALEGMDIMELAAHKWQKKKMEKEEVCEDLRGS